MFSESVKYARETSNVKRDPCPYVSRIAFCALEFSHLPYAEALKRQKP